MVVVTERCGNEVHVTVLSLRVLQVYTTNKSGGSSSQSLCWTAKDVNTR